MLRSSEPLSSVYVPRAQGLQRIVLNRVKFCELDFVQLIRSNEIYNCGNILYHICRVVPVEHSTTAIFDKEETNTVTFELVFTRGT